MTLDELRTSDIPAEGYLLAVFTDRVMFASYRKDAGCLVFEGREAVLHEPLLRLHCFDRNTEYRLLVTDDGDRLVEAVLRADEEKDMDPDLLFEDEMLLRPEYGGRKLKVINRYRYTDFDTMTVDNYRVSI